MKGVTAAFVAALLRHVKEGRASTGTSSCGPTATRSRAPTGSAGSSPSTPDKVDPGVVLTEGGWVLGQRDGKTR
ncbi:hypothetical protein BLA24_03720 [Streptomyces cinnamoneus]|uniref:Uncharacterized protein n=1 Tax=Streptomyces cinnamoneus TaxID=53446 RepID=A0A2G1XPD0_STRCJ|nr:hypothetical protein [Streptomyces cinnamoneus]PHQ53076.1 hypothetical protein BLA24_03720 [Streptomyces cinnamoneus]